MHFIYPFFIAFAMVFVSELGDKTQLLVLSFSGKEKTYKILLGVAIGSFFSHGIAILFGSQIGLLENETFRQIIEFITYISFILMGIITLIPKKEKLETKENINLNGTGKEKIEIEKPKKEGIFYKITHLKINYCLLIAISIIVGELGDKTFLASLGLGIKYPYYKISLVLGAISAMVACDFIAILFGKFLNRYISEKLMQKISGMLFLIFGLIGLFVK